MKKAEYIKKYGKEQYERYTKERYEKNKERTEEWMRTHLSLIQANSRKHSSKDGKYYKKKRLYEMTGLSHAKRLVRSKHQYKWKQFKKIIAPATQIHHEWVSNSPNYRGVALVEKNQHMHGYIDIIQILEGEITLYTEAGIKGI